MNTYNNPHATGPMTQNNQDIQNQNLAHSDPFPQTQYAPPTPQMQQLAPAQELGQGFILDSRTRRILSTVHPELVSALINIAVKKFSNEADFKSFFVQDQFLAEYSTQEQPEAAVEQQEAAAPAATSSLNFGGGW